ncbi:MAG: galactokinase [Firmicutes bacterium]|nr:galactokinase [Bacillota bacterium]MBR0481831.1 galactokinase [Bacillota bacterium]
MDNIRSGFSRQFGYEANNEYVVYGRAELAGNHTDHQHGLVIAATIDCPMRAAAAVNGTDTVNVFSEGFGLVSVKLDALHPLNKEKNTTAALVRGMASRYEKVSGFDAYITSEIPGGSGLSSSAAFEVMIGKIIEDLFDCKTDPTTLAMNAQYTENVFFGKPCGLMDQMACAYGGIIKIDFRNPIPLVERIDYDFNEKGYTLCIIDSHTDHADLTNYYAEIPSELTKVSNYFYKDNLSQVDKRQFSNQLAQVREYAGDRAVMRAMHVFDENFRVDQMAEMLKNDRIDEYLNAVNKSGDSSWMYLQNVIPSGAIAKQGLAFAIITAKFYLKGKGACRVMGGGFGGMLQAYVPNGMLDQFIINMDKVLGKGSVMPTRITKYK